ncbi:hypothetical protein [Sediminibacillus massiliensis]|uniref:hypothetical protein n=1 Tax=Sediminibacillus massiliensis TaxID=1926277 RepID=UPI000988842A|nr:hypothetical protein [Sediminibacillus massiliensis]
MSYYVEPQHYETAKSNGISKKHVDNRFYEKGWHIQRAISQPVMKRSSRDWDKWESRAKVTRSTYMQRVRGGWSHENAALTPPLSPYQVAERNNRSRKIFSPAQELQMEANGIHRATAYMRVKKLGWTKEDAVSVPVIENNESLKRARSKSGMQKLVFGQSMHS